MEPLSAYAAVAFIDATTGTGTGSASTAVTPTGSNTMIYACVGIDQAATVSSITAGGNAMSLLGTVVNTGVKLRVYYYAGASGATTVSVSDDSAITSLSAASYSGVAQTFADASSTNAALASSITDTVTTITDNSWTAMCAADNQDGAGMHAGTGSTERTGASTRHDATILDSNGTITPAGAYSQTATMDSGSARMADVMFAIQPAAGGAAPATNVLFILPTF